MAPQMAPLRPHALGQSDDDRPESSPLSSRYVDSTSRLSFTEQDSDHTTTLRDPAHYDESTSDSERTEAPRQRLLPRDTEPKTAYYDYASEKQMSHTDAKLFYQQRQRGGLTGNLDFGGPILRSQTLPVFAGADLERLSRASSLNSRRNNRSLPPSHPGAVVLPPAGFARPEKAPTAVDIQLPGRDPNSAQGSVHLVDGQLYNGPGADKPPGQHLPSESVQEPAGSGTPDGTIATAHTGTEALDGSTARSGNALRIASELGAIYRNIQEILSLRHKYLGLSLQRFGDNPKDEAGWTIYPPPPEPVWNEEKARPPYQERAGHAGTDDPVDEVEGSQHADHQPSAATNGQQRHINSQELPSSSRKPRKAGENIGEDFDFSNVRPVPDADPMTFRLDSQGVYQVFESNSSADANRPIVSVPTIREYYIDLDKLLEVSSDGPSKSFAFRRLQYLDGKFNLYSLLNEYQEIADSKGVPHRDFYNVRKVDTHVHHSACMNQKHLLRFIKSKMKKCPNEVVLFRDGKNLTLRQVFESLNLTAYDLSIDTLDMHVRAGLMGSHRWWLTIGRPTPTLSIGSTSSISSTIRLENRASERSSSRPTTTSKADTSQRSRGK